MKVVANTAALEKHVEILVLTKVRLVILVEDVLAMNEYYIHT